jgi:1-acyl-sn-glycerol-3-phosphate acyltransferase
MIYKATHHPVVYPFFKLYSLWKIKRNFHDVFVTGDYFEKKLPVLLISNHTTWWDGFWAMYLNMKLIHRKFYFMMLEEQLKKHMFFNRTGGYSVRKGSRSIIETLDYTAELLSDKNNIVMMFPQGKIESVYARNFKFEKGIEYVLKKANGSVQILFLVNLIDYFSNPRPGLYMYFKEYTGSDFSSKILGEEFNDFHAACIAENLSKNGS